MLIGGTKEQHYSNRSTLKVSCLASGQKASTIHGSNVKTPHHSNKQNILQEIHNFQYPDSRDAVLKSHRLQSSTQLDIGPDGRSECEPRDFGRNLNSTAEQIMVSARTHLQSASQFKKEMECIDEMLMNTGSVKLEDLRAARDGKDRKEDTVMMRTGGCETELANVSDRDNWLTEMLEDLAKCQGQSINKNHNDYMNLLVQ